MQFLIKKINKDIDYIEHYEILVKTKYGFETILSFHPMSGEKPLMFDKLNEAEIYVSTIKNLSKNEIKKLVKSTINDKKIIFVPSDNKWNEYYTILSNNFLAYSVIKSFHPLTGEKPLMLNNWNLANKWIKENHNETKYIKYKF